MSELLKIENLHVSVGDKELLHGINLTVEKGKVHVIMGVNGAGKSTFIRMISGDLDATRGQISFGSGERLSVLKQDHFEFDEYTVLDTVMMGHEKLWNVQKEKDEIRLEDAVFYVLFDLII